MYDMEWMHFATGLLWLGGSILFARTNRPDEPHQLRRVPLTACAFVAGIALIFVVAGAISGGLDFILEFVLIGAVIVGVAAFFSALIVDLCASALGAMRTPQWLAAGIVTAVLVTYCWISLLSELLWGAPLSLSMIGTSPMLLAPALVAAATGVVWWSELPRPDGGG